MSRSGAAGSGDVVEAGRAESQSLPSKSGSGGSSAVRKSAAHREARGRTPKARPPLAEELPVARVALSLEVPHLDRPFDYVVPSELADRAVAGVRVRVRFSGRLVDGFLIERASDSGHPGELSALHAVVGACPVLTDEVQQLVRLVSERYASTFASVVRFAVPPRHAGAEAAVLARLGIPAAQRVAGAPPAPGGSGAGPPGSGPQPASAPPAAPAAAARAAAAAPVGHAPAVPAGWSRYGDAQRWWEATCRVDRGPDEPAPRAVWLVAPGDDPYLRIAELAQAVAAGGLGVIIVAPDATEVARFNRSLAALGVPAEVLAADRGPRARYTSFMRLLTGSRSVAVGTRGVVFAPVQHCGLVVVWDDQDDSLVEPQAPGWHAREVAALRAAQFGCGLLIAGASASAESANLVDSGWAAVLDLPRAGLRKCAPLVQASGDLPTQPGLVGARLPGPAMSAIREGLAEGPVLVSVPRAGYRPGLACARCRQRATCRSCGSALLQDAGSQPRCPQHGQQATWGCPTCGSRNLRATVVGVQRTAEELGRAFPGVPVVGSWASTRVGDLPQQGESSLVLATPGCEPLPGPLGYSAAVLLDAQAALSRPGLRTGEEVLARWLRVASMVRPAAAGGRVVIVGDPSLREVQALIRWDPLGYAGRELRERREIGLPPAARVATCTGSALIVGDFVQEVAARLDGHAELHVNGPFPVGPPPGGQPPPGRGDLAGGAAQAGRLAAAGASDAANARDTARAGGDRQATRWVLVTPIRSGRLLARTIVAIQAERSARRAELVTVRVDPPQVT